MAWQTADYRCLRNIARSTERIADVLDPETKASKISDEDIETLRRVTGRFEKSGRMIDLYVSDGEALVRILRALER